jgi:hypothetical protein
VGKRHRRIRARGTTGPVAGAATENPGLSAISRRTACPSCALPDGPCPGHPTLRPSPDSNPARHSHALKIVVSPVRVRVSPFSGPRSRMATGFSSCGWNVGRADVAGTRDGRGVLGSSSGPRLVPKGLQNRGRRDPPSRAQCRSKRPTGLSGTFRPLRASRRSVHVGRRAGHRLGTSATATQDRGPLPNFARRREALRLGRMSVEPAAAPRVGDGYAVRRPRRAPSATRPRPSPTRISGNHSFMTLSCMDAVLMSSPMSLTEAGVWW